MCFYLTINLLQSLAQRMLGACANIQYPSNSIDRRNGPVESALWIVQEKCIRIITMLISSRLFVGRIAQTAYHSRFQKIESRLSPFRRFEIPCDPIRKALSNIVNNTNYLLNTTKAPQSHKTSIEMSCGREFQTSISFIVVKYHLSAINIWKTQSTSSLYQLFNKDGKKARSVHSNNSHWADSEMHNNQMRFNQ